MVLFDLADKLSGPAKACRRLKHRLPHHEWNSLTDTVAGKL